MNLQRDFTTVIGHVLPSVVEIRTSSGLGSGVVYDTGGEIVTNAHVVGSATTFTVLQSHSPTPVHATLVGRYLPDDLAVIKVSGAKNLHPASFGDSAKLQLGRAALGVQVTSLASPTGSAAGVGVVSVTSGGPAAKAGIRAGDVITAVNGTPTPDTQTLSAVLAGLRPAQVVTVKINRRHGSTATVHVKLGQLPNRS